MMYGTDPIAGGVDDVAAVAADEREDRRLVSLEIADRGAAPAQRALEDLVHAASIK